MRITQVTNQYLDEMIFNITMKKLDRGIRSALNLIRPRILPDIINWLEDNLVLPDTFPIPGPFRIKNSPQLEEPLRKAVDPYIRSITLMGCSQFGKTLFFIAVWAYKVVNDPAPSLYGHPTDAGVKAFIQQKLEPVINATPVLKKTIAKRRRGIADDSSLRYKIYPGGWLEIISLQSPGKTRQRTARDTYNDDTDEIRLQISQEGSPHENLESRTTAYKYSSKHYYGSTPRVDKSSVIQQKFEDGSQASRYITCPHCNFEQVFDEDNIVWEKDTNLVGDAIHNKFNTAKIPCTNCGYLFTDAERIELLQKAVWVHKYPQRDQHLSYHLGKASSTIGSLEKIAKARSDAETASDRGDDTAMESFINNEKGLPYKKIVATETDAKVLIDRREDYIKEDELRIIPNGVLILTGFVDAQAGSQTKPARFEYEIWGWGYGEECWICDKGTIEGSPEDINTRNRLTQYLEELEFTRKDGLILRVKRIGFDSGWAPESIYDLVAKKYLRGWYATKGANRYGARLLPLKISEMNKGKSHLLNVGSQAAKAVLFERLNSINRPGPKYIHHTKHFCNVDYFEQLTAEHAVQKTYMGLQIIVYEKRKPGLSNEAIDLWAGAFTMMRSLNINWKKLKTNMDKKTGALSNKEEKEEFADDEIEQKPVEKTTDKTKKIKVRNHNPITNY